MEEAAKNTGPRTVGFDPSVEERKVRAEENWQRIVAARASGETVTGVATGLTNGGLLVEVGGIPGFLPASQARLAEGAALDSLVKTKLPLAIVDVDPARRRVVVSQRRALENIRRAKRAELLGSLQVGQLHEAVVVRLAPFGAFIDIGGVEGLVPMSELAFERIESVGDVLAVGDRLPVTVLRIDDGGRKIAFSRKNALPDPWRDHADVVRVGARVDGKVVGKEAGKDPGMLVELAPGVVGTVRDSDADPADYEIGETIEVSVRFVDRRNRRIRLTTVFDADTGAGDSNSGFAPLGAELRRSHEASPAAEGTLGA